MAGVVLVPESRAAALEQLAEVAHRLGEVHREIGELYAAEHETKVSSWFNADSQYITERDRIAEFNALPTSLDLIRARADLAELESRRDFLSLFIQWCET